ncbi:hypothetical protein HUJ04_012734 [Dendroctonus ponderosae]|nr:hypothetical protein HUJ04_012734 [Dendroctonus ponderosae]
MQMQVSDMERRLQSIKLPRDLTLGGTKPKKVFLPNIHATRNKEKKEYLINKTEGQKKTNNRADFRNNKKGIDRSDKFIQSSGIFSDGMGSDALKKVKYERAYVPRDDTATRVPVSLPNIQTSWQIDNKSEANIYKELTDHNSASTDEEEKVAFRSRTWNESDLKEKKGKMPILDYHDSALTSHILN